MTSLVPESTVSDYSPFSIEPTIPLPERALPGSWHGQSLVFAESVLRGAFAAPSIRVAPDFLDQAAFGMSHAAPAAHVRRMVREIKELTDWSDRKLARALGVSHPTVAAMGKSGSKALARSPHAQRRLSVLHQVIVRIAPLAERKGYPLAQALEHAPGPGAPSAVDLVQLEDGSQAYLAAMDVINPKRGKRMMKSPRPVTAGRSTVDLTE